MKLATEEDRWTQPQLVLVKHGQTDHPKAWFLIRVYCVATHIVARDHVTDLKAMQATICSDLAAEAQSMFKRRFLILISLEIRSDSH